MYKILHNTKGEKWLKGVQAEYYYIFQQCGKEK